MSDSRQLSVEIAAGLPQLNARLRLPYTCANTTDVRAMLTYMYRRGTTPRTIQSEGSRHEQIFCTDRRGGRADDDRRNGTRSEHHTGEPAQHRRVKVAHGQF